MRILAALLFVLLSCATPVRAFTLSNFDIPESVALDPDDGSYFVSNINGGLTERDGNGYISRIGSSGMIVIQKYIGGKGMALDAPKGLVVTKKHVITADIDSVKAFDKKTRKLAWLVDLAPLGAEFLNDVAQDETGRLYVSDTMAQKIFMLDPAADWKPSIFMHSSALGSPNGLLVNPKTKNLMVVTWQTGRILEIDKSGKIHVLKKGLSTLDGMDFDAEGNLYVSSFEKGEIYRISYYGRGTLTTFLSGLTAPADIACDRPRNELVIPSFKNGTVTTART